LQDTFPIRAHNDATHDTPATTPTYSYYPSHHAHLLAYRFCTNHVRPPFAFRINQGRLVPVSLSLVRDLLHFATPLTDQKFHIIKLFSLSPLGYCTPADCISCTIRAVVFALFVPIPPTLPWIFILFTRTPRPHSFSSLSARWSLSLFLVIMRVFTVGLVSSVPLVVICVIN